MVKLYKYGLPNVLDDIQESLVNALNTNNKIAKTRYIGEAYGMVKALDALTIIDEAEEDEEDDD